MKNHLCEKESQQDVQSKFRLGCEHTVNYYVLTSHGIICKQHTNNAGGILHENVSATFITR
jgi:hypothetical protein